MKIRILGDSIRFRLSQTEVQQLHQRGVVEEKTHFGTPDHVLTYCVHAYVGDHIRAQFIQNEIRAMVPDQLVKQWAESSEISLSNEMAVSPDSSLAILIEKDFKCLDSSRKEDESDLFPHPKEEHLKC